MKKPRSRFRDRSLREMRFQIAGVAAIVLVVAFAMVWSLIPEPLPKLVRLGAGPAGSEYARFGEELRDVVAENDVEIELVTTAGSMENIRLLEAGEIDVGLVQSGNLRDAEDTELRSIAAVAYELILIVERADWGRGHIEGGRIAIGVPGSGGHQLARQFLTDQGVGEGVPPGTRLVEIAGEAALAALLAGEVDSGIFVVPPEAPWVRTIFADPGLRGTDFVLAEAFTRHYRYLRRLVIPAGLLDLRTEVPRKDVEVIATTASLVIGPDAHSALIPLLIDSTRTQLRQGTLFAGPGVFPSAMGVDAPLADEARSYFKRGPSFLYRWLPFRWAFAATRFSLLLVPLFTLLYPLYHMAKPAYGWAIRHRVYRWYRVLKKLERRMEESRDAESLLKVREDLDRIGDEIRHTLVPASYASSLFALRAHHQQIVSRLESLEATRADS
jgi:TRAP-type uncharacterized transport system substrate-binding protein